MTTSTSSQSQSNTMPDPGFLTTLSSMRDTFSDITLKAGNRVFKAHRLILSCRSPVFKAMLSSGFKEGSTNTPTVELGDDDEHAVAALLDFFYTEDDEYNATCGHKPLSFHMMVFAIADKYMCPPLAARALEKFKACVEQDAKKHDTANATGEVAGTGGISNNNHTSHEDQSSAHPAGQTNTAPRLNEVIDAVDTCETLAGIKDIDKFRKILENCISLGCLNHGWLEDLTLVELLMRHGMWSIILLRESFGAMKTLQAYADGIAKTVVEEAMQQIREAQAAAQGQGS